MRRLIVAAAGAIAISMLSGPSGGARGGGPAPDGANEARNADRPNVSAIEARLRVWNAGRALLDEGRNEEAARFFETALGDGPARVELAGGLVDARSRLCAPNAAMAFCARRLSESPDSAAAIFKPFLSGEREMLLRNFGGAARYFSEASATAGRSMDGLSAAMCGAALARALLENGEDRDALDALRKLPAIDRDPAAARRFLVSVAALEARCLEAADRAGAADTLYRETLDRATTEGFTGVRSACLAGLGGLDEKRGRYGEARSRYTGALGLERSQGNRERTGAVLIDLARVEVDLGAVGEAEAHLAAAEETAKACGLKWILASVLSGRASIAELAGDREAALNLFQQSAALYRELGNVPGELAAELELGALRGELGEYTKAIRHYETALESYEGMTDRPGLGRALAGLAAAYHKLGDYQRAETYYRRTLEVQRELGDDRGAASTLGSLGMIAGMQGRYGEAFAYENEALTVRGEIGDRAGVGEAYFSMGSLSLGLGDDGEAVRRYEKAFALAMETRNRSLLERVADGMGSAYSSAGRMDLAEKLYRKCLEIARASKEETEIVWALDNLASLEIQAGDPASARRHLEEALSRMPSVEQDRLRARSLYLLGIASGPSPSSIDDLDRALALAEKGGLEDLRWRCLSDLGAYRLSLGDTAQSYSLQHRAILSVESLRRLAGADELRRTFLEPAVLPYERIVAIILTRSGRAQDVKEAFSYTERCRAQILAALLREAIERMGAKGNDRLLGREREVLSRITFYQARLQDGRLASGERERYLENIEGLERRFVSLSLQLEAGDREYVAALYPKVEQPDELLSALAPGERMLSYFLGERHSYLFCAVDTQLAVYTLPAKAVIEQRVGSFVRLLQQSALASAYPAGAGEGEALDMNAAETDAGATERPVVGPALPREVLDLASSELYDLLIGPVARSIKPDERLVIIPDGLLQRLPFALLAHEGRRLVQDHDISFAPSLRTLRYLRGRNAVRASSPRVPEYNIIAIGAGGEGEAGSAGRPRVYPFTRIPVEPFPGAVVEARDVASIFPRSLVLAGRTAVASVFKGSRLDDTGILHLEARAYVDNDDVRRSFIVLNRESSAGDSLAEPSENGILPWQEIAALKLNAALVTLAACRSAGGALAAGAGLSGLTDAFLYAGGGCVLAAGLDVPDDLAGELMVEYYRNVRNGLDAAAALGAAQRSALARKDALASPAVWGSFVVIGDGASAPRLSREITFAVYVAVALVAAAAVIIAFTALRRRRW
jgi:CHAT domain-containing protein/tetratricopeptide (TPR) repeat protein